LLILPKLGCIIPNMGKVSAAQGLADSLFSSVQQRVLAPLFGQPDRSFHTSEIIRLAKSGTGAVQRELARLTQSGIVTATSVGNQRHYRANLNSPIFEELRGLILKTVGLTIPLRAALARHSKKIKVAFVYGSVAKGRDTAKSDIDVMIIADRLSYRDIYSVLQTAEKKLGRPINPNLFTVSDWKRKISERNPFVIKISAQPKIFIFGSEHDIA
jgi:predicted nucleotidyltransferase